MERMDFLTSFDNFGCPSFKKDISARTSTINPWTQQQLTNPFLHIKKQQSEKLIGKKHGQRKFQRDKIHSVNQQKLNNKFLSSLPSKQISQSNRKSKQLPKLNIGHLIRTEPIKKKKNTYNSNQNLLNSSPIHYSTMLKKQSGLYHSAQLYRSNKVFPAVSRQLKLTRKIFLLEHKLNSSNQSSPIKNFQRNDGNLRRLVQRQWQKKN